MNSLRQHYPEYFIEAICLGAFMISASVFTVVMEHPGSPLRQAIADPLLRRFLLGIGMGLTAIALIYSPWGQRSGAHMNPAVTLTFWRLGKIKRWDAVFYIAAQFLGGFFGLVVASKLLGNAIAAPTINYVVTVPGAAGTISAFLAELIISFGLMLLVLWASNHPRRSPYTGFYVGILLVIYITLEAPLSGMSMNPARTLASAIPAQNWTAIWIYFTAPLIGMWLASTSYVKWKGHQNIYCAKLHHTKTQRCIFHCGYRQPTQHTDVGSPLSDDLPTKLKN